MTKYCRRCATVKPIAEFYPNRLTPDGRESKCKACKRAARWKLAQLENLDEERETEAAIAREEARAKRVNAAAFERLRQQTEAARL